MAFEAGTAPGVLGALGTATWLFLPLLYLILLPLVCVPSRRSDLPGRSDPRKEVQA